MNEFRKQQFLPITISEAWSFFSTPLNLGKITPPDLSLTILSRDSLEKISLNQIIDYKVKPMFNIPVKWRTKITLIEEPYRFVDKQIRGPYKFWEHLHEFRVVEGGVLVIDTVKYEIPFGFLGRLLKGLIHKKIDNIFVHRSKVLKKKYVDGTIN